jgi:hypothetical protein
MFSIPMLLVAHVQKQELLAADILYGSWYLPGTEKGLTLVIYEIKRDFFPSLNNMIMMMMIMMNTTAQKRSNVQYSH